MRSIISDRSACEPVLGLGNQRGIVPGFWNRVPTSNLALE
jgi:hypothetical protein